MTTDWTRVTRNDDAEDMYATALALTRQQDAKMLELRTTVSLAQLRHRQGKSREAHQALTAIYGWFSEGFQSTDLCKARALLDQLAHGVN